MSTSFRAPVAGKHVMSKVLLEPARPRAGAHGGEAFAGDSGSRRFLVLAVLCLTLLITNLDGTILNVALPTIVRTLHATSSQLQWIVDSYTMVFAGLLLISGSLGDHLGRKWVFIGGLAIFAVGSATSAFSRSPDQLIAARAFMGIGATAIMPSTLSILTNVFTEPVDRARAIGLWSGTSGLELAIGPVVGGWLLTHYWWGSVFLINVPIAAAACVAALVIVPNSLNANAQRPDVVGAGCSLLGVALLLWGIIEAPVRGWASPTIIVAIAGAVVIAFTFVMWERHTKHPLLELSFFKSRRFSVAMAGLGLVLFALSGALFLLTQYLQFCLGYTALQTGLRIAPIAAVLFVVASLSSFAVRVVGTKVVVFCGMALITLGLAMLSAVTIHSTYANVLPAFFLLGIGTGLAIAPCTESVMGSVPVELAGVGSATNSTALQIGSALGVAVLGSLLSTRYQADMRLLLRHVAVPSSVVRTTVGSLGGALGLAHHVGGVLGAQLAASARQSFINGMVFAVSVGTVIAAVASTVVAIFLPARAPESGRKQ
jgi:EmrB/QacA subfamily drug resistance transporter